MRTVIHSIMVSSFLCASIMSARAVDPLSIINDATIDNASPPVISIREIEPTSQTTPSKLKNPALASTISFFLPGVGQGYAGDGRRGAFIALGEITLIILAGRGAIKEMWSPTSEDDIFLPLAAGLHLWQTWDAYQTAEKYNATHTLIPTVTLRVDTTQRAIYIARVLTF